MVVRKNRQKKSGNEWPKELTPWQIENLKYQKEMAEAKALAEEKGTTDLTDEVQSHAEGEEKLVVTNGKDSETSSEEEETAIEDQQWEVTESGQKRFKLSTEAELDQEIEGSVKKIKDLPKSLSFADKLPKMKESRQQRLKKRLIILLSLFSILVFLLLYYVSPLSKVRTVKVVGNDKVASESVVSSLQLHRKEFIWAAYFDKDMLTNVKKENQRINTIDRKLIGINGLKIIVTEHADVAYLKSGEKLLAVLDDGTIVKENVMQPDNKYPVMIGFKEGKVLKAFAEKFYIVSSEVKDNIKEIHATPSKVNPYLFTIYMDDGNEILASTRDYYEKINYYPNIAKQMPENGLVDMEAGVFSKSYATIAAEEAAKKKAIEDEKLAKGEILEPDTGTVKDKITKEDSVSGLGYDKWLEKLKEGDVADILTTPVDKESETEVDPQLDQPVEGVAPVGEGVPGLN